MDNLNFNEEKQKLQLDKLRIEIEEIKRRSSLWQPALKYIIAGIVISGAVITWVITIYMPLNDLKNDLALKRDEIREIELKRTKMEIEQQRDSLKQEMAMIIKQKTKIEGEYGSLLVLYSDLQSKNKISKKEYGILKANADGEIAKLQAELRKLKEVMIGGNELVTSGNDYLVDNEGNPLVFDKSTFAK